MTTVCYVHRQPQITLNPHQAASQVPDLWTRGAWLKPFPNLQSWRPSLHAGYFTLHPYPAPDLTLRAINATFTSSLSLTPSHPQFSALALRHHSAMKHPVPMYITGG